MQSKIMILKIWLLGNLLIYQPGRHLSWNLHYLNLMSKSICFQYARYKIGHAIKVCHERIFYKMHKIHCCIWTIELMISKGGGCYLINHY